MRVAVIHDWLLGMRGGERCLECILDFFPHAEVYTLFFDQRAISEAIRRHEIHSSVLNELPFVKKYYRYLLPFYALGLRSLEKKVRTGGYDLVVSISHCVAKNVKVNEGTFHLCYCLTPARYLWDQYESYFAGKKIEPLVRPIIAFLRQRDVNSASGVSRYVAISNFVAERIRTYYRREADVVYPPVRTDWITPKKTSPRGPQFLCVNALVPYKNVELVIETFNELGLPLTVVGTGPLERKLRAMAKPNITFFQWLKESDLAELYREASALVFAAEEDFGMIPVEIMSAGTPVICYGKGGVLETMSRSPEKPTAVFFSELSTAGLSKAIKDFIVRQDEFTVDNCISQAQYFSLERFREDFSRVLTSCGIEPLQQGTSGWEKRQVRTR